MWVQGKVVAQPVQTALVPSYFFSLIQGGIQHAARQVTVADRSAQSNEALQEQVRQYQDELTQLKQLADQAKDRLDAQSRAQLAGIGVDRVIWANVYGSGASPGRSILHLARGTSDGVSEGDLVALGDVPEDRSRVSGLTLLGRIETADEKVSVAQLFSDPLMKVSAEIIRTQLQAPGVPGVARDLRITTEPCLVEGLGANQMAIRDVNVEPNVQPQAGDLVVLSDNHFPDAAQFMVIGVINDIGRRDAQPLRYSISVSPRVPVTSLRSVMIIRH
jgi:cell shape-determining protein MreC